MIKCDQRDLELLYKCLQITVDRPIKMQLDLAFTTFFGAEVLQNMSIFVRTSRVFADVI